MKYKGSCHCGSIKFEIDSDLEKIVQCNCSICIKRNAKMIMIPKENFKILEGSEHLSLYQFNTEIAKHFFCKKCGIYTHHNRKSDPNGMGVNLGCIDDVDPMKFDVIQFDGKKL
ncbi:GFA family protein [Alphaproteobacteria bacterium]|nr:GFA family protein [Alphaproteobacteria bacterium]